MRDRLILILAALTFLAHVRGATSSVLVNVTVLNQTNVVHAFSDMGNTIMCQNITDKWGIPWLRAADDFLVPPLDFFKARGITRGLQDCGAMSITISSLRYKNDLNPYSVTLEFIRHNTSSGLPALSRTIGGNGGSPTTVDYAVFYKKTWPWPTNNYMWQRDTLSRLWPSQFRLQLNELGDDGVTRFNFYDDRSLEQGGFMPAGHPIWVSFYVTMPQHTDSRMMSNTMYWATLTNETGSTRVATNFFDGGGGAATTAPLNQNFVFRDETDFLGQGYRQWTTAVPVEREMLIAPTTNNMAWRVAFECLQELITAAPTIEGPSHNNNNTPSAINNYTLSPLDYASPSNDQNNNDTDGRNRTGTDGHTNAALHLLWIIALPLSLLLVIGGVAYVVWRRRHKPPFKGKGYTRPVGGGTSTDDILDDLRESDDDAAVRLSVRTASRSEASLFDDDDDDGDINTAGADKKPQSYHAGAINRPAGRNNNGPMMIAVPTTVHDRNNPFTRHTSDLMHVTISEDNDDDL